MARRQWQGLTTGWTFRRAVDTSWLPATVPGCVHTDLLAAGKIEDPFFRLNERDQQWIENEDWEYRTTLAVDEALLGRARIELLFEGLDTFAQVSLNGAPVLAADNMFRSWRVDAKPHLRSGDNELLVRFRSPIAEVKPAYDRLGYVLPAPNDQAPQAYSVFARKAPYHYGWDWGPRFVTSGVWRRVWLDAWDEARLDDVQIFQRRLDDGEALLDVVARVVAHRGGCATLTVRIDGAVAAVTEQTLPIGETDVTIPVRIANPQRWWPNGLGAQRLYAFETTLAFDGVTCDVRPAPSFGLRTITVRHERDAAGKSFTVEVNGAPLFMKGANWIPADSFVTRMTPTRYQELLRSAAAAHMNMLRVWGGGIYEDGVFYALCDQLGILVWQDFMFACSAYPGDDAFLENVRREAVDNVRRLRNHACLALWAGNNEIEAALDGWGWAQKYRHAAAAQAAIRRDYDRLFKKELPAIVAAEDPGRFYTSSSPGTNDPAVKANRPGWGDMHYWGVWHAEAPYEAYADHISRFMSEYGFQSFPALRSVVRYIDPETDWGIDSPVMLAHQRHPRGNALVRAYMERDFRTPTGFGSFLYVSQVLQATVIKYAAEAHRRAMGRNWGSLYWQLDDCWPVASWSGIDYYGCWKALHHAARRFFAPLLVSPVDRDGIVEIWGISDRRHDTPARLTLRLVDFNGGELWRREQEVSLAANASSVLWSAKKRDVLSGAVATRVVLVAELAASGEETSRNLLFFAKTKDLALPRPTLAIDVAPAPLWTATVTVRTDRFARAIYLHSDIGGNFSDNFFDLLPGESVTVSFRPPALPAAGSLADAIRATTIADSYDHPDKGEAP